MASRSWPFNGYVVNQSSKPVTVWSDDRGVYTINSHSESSRYHDDVDHIRDVHGQWFKIGVGNVTVDSGGNVHGYKCKTHTYGVDH